MKTRIAILVAIGILLAVLYVLAGPAETASAHPLGNFSVNQLDAVALYPSRVDVAVAVDVAELPTLQDKSAVDRDGDGVASPAERAAFAGSECRSVAAAFAVRVGGSLLHWTVRPGGYAYVPGSAGLSTSRLDCSLSAPADLGERATIAVKNSYRTDRVGWREITAAGHGVHLDHSPVPARDISDGLRKYPKDLLSSPLDVRSVQLAAVPGAGASTSYTPAATGSSFIGKLTAGLDEKLRGMLGSRQLTPTVGLLAVLLSLVLGAGHAALPGHGKTVMAAYLAGRRGRRRDALVVGATVTLTHTGGVLVLGLVLTAAASLAGETVLAYLGVASGILVTTVGVGMLFEARRNRPHSHSHGHSHAEPHSHTEPHSELHSHAEPHAHSEPHSHSGGRRPSRLGLIGVGIAGGLVPSPSALVILLGAIALGRTVFGVILVLGYGIGMAAALTAAGLALIVLQARWERRARRPLAARLTARWSAAAPIATAGVVVLVGLGLAGRALITV